MLLDPSILQNAAPASVEEALLLAEKLFSEIGVQRAQIVSSTPSGNVSGLAGVSFCVTLPLNELEALAQRELEAVAAEQGIKVDRSELRITQEQPGRLDVTIEGDAKAFLGSLTVRVTGALTLQADGTLRFEEMRMDAGAGMFAGMAGALVRPKLAKLQAQPIDLRRTDGFSLRFTGLRVVNTAVEVELTCDGHLSN
jgi:hypothetical protein